jgi:hypothetical protein
MRGADEYVFACAAEEVARIMRDWFDSGDSISAEDTLGRIIIALERRGVLFAERELPPPVSPEGEGNVIPFPRRRSAG